MHPLSDEPPVVVGHSLGAYVVPLVAARRPVRHQVFLCAVPDGPGEPIGERSAAILTPDLLAVHYYADADGCTMQSPASFFHLFYEDVPPADALDGLRRLRPQGSAPLTEPWPLQQWPATPRTIERYTTHFGGTSFGTKFEGLKVSMELPEKLPGLYHAGSVGIIMSGWLGTINYGVIVANRIDKALFEAKRAPAAAPAIPG